MKQLAPNLYCVFHCFGQMPSFIIDKNEKELFLVDAGMKSTAKALIRQVKKKWGSLDRISTLILTHKHLDHVSGLPFLIEKIPNLQIICHQDELKSLMEQFKDKNIIISRAVKHNDYVDKKLKLRVIHTPGHTFGHICLLLEDQKILLLGDLLMTVFCKLSPVFKKFHDDTLQWKTTLPFILEYKWDYAIPSHLHVKKIPRMKIESFIVKTLKE